MKLEKIKEKMINFRDFYDQDLLDSSYIENAKTKEELYIILQNHVKFLEGQATDAHYHINKFIESLDLINVNTNEINE
jgi:hypothetical protein